MDTFGGERSKMLSNQLDFKQNIIKICEIYPQMPSFLQICVVIHAFYPNLPIFLHIYICHIFAILQLWLAPPLVPSYEKFGDTSILSQFMLFCRKICFVAIYAVLSQNVSCRNLRAFAWRKIGPKIVPVEKKGQISGMLKINSKCNPG